jgi:hypothetical protein
MANVRHLSWGWQWLWLAAWLPLQAAVMLAFVLIFQDPRPPLRIMPPSVWGWIVKWINFLANLTVAAMFYLFILGWLVAGIISRSALDLGESFLQWLAAAGDILGFLLPWGWPTTMVYEAGVRQNGYMTLILVPLAGWIYLGYCSFQYLKEAYQGPWQEEDPILAHYQELADGEIEQPMQGTTSARLADEPQGQQPCDVFPSPGQGVSALTDYLLKRQFLRHYSWNVAGWLERLVLRCLNTRQELVLQMLLLGQPGWSKSWRDAWVVMMVFAALLAAFPTLQHLAIIGGAIIISAMAWPVLGGHWPGLRPVIYYRTGFSFVSFYPVSFREISRIIFTCNTIRLLAGMPIGLVFGGVVGWLLRQPLGMSLWLALKISLLGLAIQPAVFVYSFANNCGDERRFSALIKTLMALWFILLVALAAASIFVPVWWASLLVFLLLGCCCWLLFLWFRWRFEQMKFDWAQQTPVR